MTTAISYWDGEWRDGGQPLIGPHDHAFFMASVVFDGARAFGGHTPDLDRHCARVIASAKGLLLEPDLSAEAITALCREGVAKFPKGAELYIRPMFFAMRGFVLPERGSTRFVLAINELAMPEPGEFGVCFSTFRRPARDAAPTDTKAACLYPNMQRALAEAQKRGFQNAITFDPNGNVAELATANLWIAKDGVALTPVCNGTFLNGITRQRVIQLLRAEGVRVEETTLTRGDILAADEVFTTGNYGKVLPITRLEDKIFAAGPIYRRARQLYWDFAASSG
jgi:branched-chain amino acid aminotransferase